MSGKPRSVALLGIGALTGGVLAGGGVAVAVAQAPAPVRACVANNGGATRIVGPRATCRRGEHLVRWNQTGPPGARGPKGPRGPSEAYIDTQSFNHLVGNTPTTVAFVDLPAGTYLIQAATQINYSYAYCGISANAQRPAHTQFLRFTEGQATYRLLSDTIKLSMAGKATVVCTSSEATAPSVGADLTAIPVTKAFVSRS